MKTLPTIASSLVFSALLLTAQAQTPATPPHNPTPAKVTNAAHGGATYQGPKVTKDSKALGQKMMQKSKPTDMLLPPLARPVKK